MANAKRSPKRRATQRAGSTATSGPRSLDQLLAGWARAERQTLPDAAQLRAALGIGAKAPARNVHSVPEPMDATWWQRFFRQLSTAWAYVRPPARLLASSKLFNWREIARLPSANIPPSETAGVALAGAMGRPNGEPGARPDPTPNTAGPVPLRP